MKKGGARRAGGFIISHWILGITGGIAAYKTPMLVRLMKQQGWDVRVVLSHSAESFVTPLTLQAVSGTPVHQHLLDPDAEAGMGHIQLARWAEGIIIAPLSANRLAALALGMADDLLTTLCLATRAPVFVAPAMNQQMWHHPATQQHIATLRARGVSIIGPAFGEQACGDVGLGRMEEPEIIFEQLCKGSTASDKFNKILKGKTILITAGPTREYFDPVRYISNRSSGKMGFALAEAAVTLGAKVILVSGPVSLNTPREVLRYDVVSAKEMHHCVLEQIDKVDIFISAAAVCDYRPQIIQDQKLKKQPETSFHFEMTRDILSDISHAKLRPFCIGFAAETENHLINAQQKLIQKNLDAIAVNDVSRDDIGFDADENALQVITKTGSINIPKGTKYQVALQLLKSLTESIEAKENTHATNAVEKTNEKILTI